MKIASRATPEGLAGHMWPAGHGLSTTDLEHKLNGKCICVASMRAQSYRTLEAKLTKF